MVINLYFYCIIFCAAIIHFKLKNWENCSGGKKKICTWIQWLKSFRVSYDLSSNPLCKNGIFFWQYEEIFLTKTKNWIPKAKIPRVILHWKKLFWIDFLQQKIKTSKAIQTIKFVIVLNFVKFHTLKIIFIEITQGRLALQLTELCQLNHISTEKHVISEKKESPVFHWHQSARLKVLLYEEHCCVLYEFDEKA